MRGMGQYRQKDYHFLRPWTPSSVSRSYVNQSNLNHGLSSPSPGVEPPPKQVAPARHQGLRRSRVRGGATRRNRRLVVVVAGRSDATVAAVVAGLAVGRWFLAAELDVRAGAALAAAVEAVRAVGGQERRAAALTAGEAAALAARVAGRPTLRRDGGDDDGQEGREDLVGAHLVYCFLAGFDTGRAYRKFVREALTSNVAV
ncbi:hypothetical protein PG987_001390 [Apiospora arundinis]